MFQVDILCFIIIEYQFLIIPANSQTDLLSKFHQTDYKIEFQRIELVSYDKSTLNFVDIKTFKFNRTTPVVNLTVNTKKDLGDGTEIVVQAYKFVSNEYRTFPLRFQVNCCKSLERNIIGCRNLLKCGNFTKCQVYKDVTYRICNFGIDQSRFPPLLPNGDFRIQIEFLDNNKIIVTVSTFIKIYRPITVKNKN